MRIVQWISFGPWRPLVYIIVTAIVAYWLWWIVFYHFIHNVKPATLWVVEVNEFWFPQRIITDDSSESCIVVMRITFFNFRHVWIVLLPSDSWNGRCSKFQPLHLYSLLGPLHWAPEHIAENFIPSFFLWRWWLDWLIEGLDCLRQKDIFVYLVFRRLVVLPTPALSFLGG